MAREPAPDVRIAGEKMGVHPHICAFFHSREEEYRIMMPFIKGGIEHGEKALHIVDPDLQQDHFQRLKDGGLDPVELERQKQLEVQVWEKVHVRNNGGFDMNDMLGLVQEILTNAKREGFPRSRVIGHMEWSLEDRPGVEHLLEYESRLNYVLSQFQDPVICVYDLAKFSAATVIEILRTHPMVIIGGILQENPFYVQPDDYLRQLKLPKPS